MLKTRQFGKFMFSSLGTCYRTSSNNRNISILSSLIDVHPQVQNDLESNKPIVALESTIITHGMPYPHNLDTALLVENIVKENGSTPATIAIIDGRVKIGLDDDELKRLACLSANKNDVVKCSRRDFGYVLSRKLSGGTTVAGTLFIANLIGIKIFATGGIGGVHREGHETFDISADLIELGKTPMAVISSGIKSILDIPRTLEYLETQGVCVASYKCPTKDFPAFYTRSSGHKVSYNLNDPTEVAELIKATLDINLNSGILIGVPIPEEYSIPENKINIAIENALIEIKQKNICGKDVTPFVLEAVSKITKGQSLSSNMALIKNNAKVASEIAVKLHEMLQPKSNNHKHKYNNNNVERTMSNKNINANQQMENIELNNNINFPVVVGASILDMCMTVQDEFSVR